MPRKPFPAAFVVLVMMLGLSAFTPKGAAEEPESASIETEIRASYSEYGGEVRYFDGASDLSGEGHPEIVVHVAGSMVCGTTYPANPTVPPAVCAPETGDATSLIPVFASFSDGTLICE